MNEHELMAQPVEAYMSEAQQAFFKQRLETERKELSRQIDAEFQAKPFSRESREPTSSSTRVSTQAAESRRRRP